SASTKSRNCSPESHSMGCKHSRPVRHFPRMPLAGLLPMLSLGAQRRRWLAHLVAIVVLASAGVGHAAEAASTAAPVVILPSEVHLHGPEARQRLVVQRQGADGALLQQVAD